MNRVGAFLLAPAPAAAVGAAVSWGSGGFPRPVSVFVFYMLVIYAAQLIFGLAIRAFLVRAGRNSATAFALGGTLMIALPALPFVVWAVAEHPHQLAKAPFVLALFLLMGAVTGASAWLLTRSEEPTPPSL
jgi:hypothetical protein